MARKLAITADTVRDGLGGSGVSAYLAGLGDTNKQNAILEKQIAGAMSKLESTLGIYFYQEVIKTDPTEAGLSRGVDADFTKTEAPYDFVRSDWDRVGRIRVRRGPIRSVQRVAVRFGQNSTVHREVEYPADWIDHNRDMRTVYLVPIAGSVSYGANSFIFLPITGGAIRRDLMPNFITVDYTAGYLPQSFNPASDDPLEACPDYEYIEDLLQCLTNLTCARVLKTLNRSLGAGGGGIGMYGLNRSFQANRFKDEIQEYMNDVKEFISDFNVTRRPPAIRTISSLRHGSIGGNLFV